MVSATSLNNNTSLPADVWFADPNGTPDHRRHLTRHFAEEIRRELTAGDLA